MAQFKRNTGRHEIRAFDDGYPCSATIRNVHNGNEVDLFEYDEILQVRDALSRVLWFFENIENTHGRT